MNAGDKRWALAFAAALALATLAHAPRVAGGTAQTEPQRRTQGPAAGPAIRLPRGEGAAAERGQSPDPKERAGREAAAPRTWEYCVIKGFRYHQKGLSLSSSTRPAAFVRYFPEGSEEVEGGSEDEALGNAFAKLGEEGWELAGVRTDLSLNDGDGKTSTVYFFKRPKRQE